MTTRRTILLAAVTTLVAATSALAQLPADQDAIMRKAAGKTFTLSGYLAGPNDGPLISARRISGPRARAVQSVIQTSPVLWTLAPGARCSIRAKRVACETMFAQGPVGDKYPFVRVSAKLRYAPTPNTSGFASTHWEVRKMTLQGFSTP